MDKVTMVSRSSTFVVRSTIRMVLRRVCRADSSVSGQHRCRVTPFVSVGRIEFSGGIHFVADATTTVPDDDAVVHQASC